MNAQEEFTDQQILASLLSKRVKLELQLSKVNIAISAYEDTDLIPQATQVNLNTKDASYLKKTSLNLPEAYEVEMTYTDKVLFAVKELRFAVVDDIVNYIVEKEPINADIKDELHHRVTQVASRLYGKKRLRADKVGRKFRYKL